MQRFKKVLVVVDESRRGQDAALVRAEGLAIRNQAQLTAVAALDCLPRDMGLAKELTPEELQERISLEVQRELEQRLVNTRQIGIAVSCKVLWGKPFVEIIGEVLRQGHDLVMLTPEKQQKMNWFGSTATHLLRKCPCPVWVLKANSRKRFSRILAAVDPDPFDETKNELCLKIMELATSLSEQEAAELHIVHSWYPTAAPILRSRLHLAGGSVDRFLRETRELHAKWLQDLVETFAQKGRSPHVHLQSGDPGNVIAGMATQHRIDAVVMGTVGRTGVPGFLIGNTAESVLHSVGCSLLAVKPDGFVSPVKLQGEE